MTPKQRWKTVDINCVSGYGSAVIRAGEGEHLIVHNDSEFTCVDTILGERHIARTALATRIVTRLDCQ